MNIWKAAERSISISVDSYEDKNITGRLWHEEQETGLRFTNLMQLLLGVESLLRDEERLEVAAPHHCALSPDSGRKGREILGLSPGKLATFQLKILFRQHASWQGAVTWVENRQEMTFRSVLELTMLMDSSLSQIESLDYGRIV